MVNRMEFDCPVCGNPLIKSRNPKKHTLRCKWCKRLINSDGSEYVEANKEDEPSRSRTKEYS